MIEKTIKITNKTGLHARPASKLVQEAALYKCEITISKEGRSVNAKSMISLLSLGVNCGAEIMIRTSGADEIDAMSGIVALIENMSREENLR